MAAVRAWPRWSDPVTFGGGMTMTNFSESGFFAAAASSQPYQPLFSHHSCQAPSTSAGL